MHELTNRQIAELWNGLVSLNGYTRVKGDAVVNVPYDFTGAVRRKVADNFAALREAHRAFEARKLDLIRSVTGGKESIDPEAERSQYDQFLSAIRPIEEDKVKVDGLSPLSDEDLKLDKNPIPPGTLATLDLLKVGADESCDDDE
ncbi:MAG: hypothetical protein NDI75_15030 [Candidatus Didemnitutus sp.]|nr:hypothetical protein [Candidatus Didemnitutus sp.]